MDKAQLDDIMNQKKENPRLIRKPLNLGSKFAKQGSQQVIPEILTEYSVLLILFGAGWCNITKPFSDILKKHYQQINLEKKNIEIVFVSIDKQKSDYDSIVKDMPWLCIPFEDQRVKDLKQFYNVRAIPELILVSNDGQIVSKKCRNDIYQLGQDEAYQKWLKQKDYDEQRKK